ncbi:hypothetical protein DIPPA_18647 [Diplonema papillatum]|nr:hypothetical protein DIPPA_18647 [Diplonema papillatum]
MKSLLFAQANRLLEGQARSCTTWLAKPQQHLARLSDTRDAAGRAELRLADMNQSYVLSTAQPLVSCYPRLEDEMQSQESSSIDGDSGSAVSRWAQRVKGAEKEQTPPVCAIEGTSPPPGALFPHNVKAGSNDASSIASGCVQKNDGEEKVDALATNEPMTPGYQSDLPDGGGLPGNDANEGGEAVVGVAAQCSSSNTQTDAKDESTGRDTCRSGENSGGGASESGDAAAGRDAQHPARSSTEQEDAEDDSPGIAANKSVETTASRTVQPSVCTGQEGDRAAQWSVQQTLGTKFGGQQQQAEGEEQEMVGVRVTDRMRSVTCNTPVETAGMENDGGSQKVVLISSKTVAALQDLRVAAGRLQEQRNAFDTSGSSFRNTAGDDLKHAMSYVVQAVNELVANLVVVTRESASRDLIKSIMGDRSCTPAATNSKLTALGVTVSRMAVRSARGRAKYSHRQPHAKVITDEQKRIMSDRTCSFDETFAKLDALGMKASYSQVAFRRYAKPASLADTARPVSQ